MAYICEYVPTYGENDDFLNLKNFGEMYEISSDHTFAELVSEDGQYTLSMPNTCSYYTTAFSGVMKRNGQTILHFDNENKFCFAFADKFFFCIFALTLV